MKRIASSSAVACMACFAFAIAAGGCGEDESTARQDPPIQVAAPEGAAKTGMQTGPAHANGTAADPKVIKTGPFDRSFDGIHFSVPAGWQEVENPTPDFVDARFQIPTPHGPIKLTFSSNAGGIDINIKRWIGQFQLSRDKQPTVGEIKVDGVAARWIDLAGEFMGGGMGAVPVSSSPVERMLGVAIPLGARDFYLKLTGTDAAVTDIRDAFRDFVRSARINSASSVSSGGSSGK